MPCVVISKISVGMLFELALHRAAGVQAQGQALVIVAGGPRTGRRSAPSGTR